MAIPIIQTVGLAVMTLAAIIAAGFILFDNDPLRYEFYDIKNKYPWMSGGDGSDYYCPAELDEETTKRSPFANKLKYE